MGTGQWAIDLCAVRSGIGPVVDESLVVSHENGRAKPTKVLTLASSVALALDVRTRTECTTQHRPTCLFQPLMSLSHFRSTALVDCVEESNVGDCGRSGAGSGHSSSCRTAACVEFPERDRLVDETTGASTTVSRRSDNDSGSGAL